MMAFTAKLKSAVAQNTLEYLLAMGAIAIPLVLLLLAAFRTVVPEMIGWVCPSVDTADATASKGSCLP
jgi:hypothetical protein